tara:strand:+ start:49 stop:705 length:657 start_codon:yes stop_codon:yes gene_type:complete
MSKLKLSADSGSGTVALVAPASTTGNADVELKLPVTVGTAGQVLKNSSTPGTLEFGDASAGGASNISFNNGNGIDFSASEGAGVTSGGSILHDYEEGTWTVTDLTSDGVTFTGQSNRYTKVGRQVFVQANITFPNSGLSGAAMKMGGLPFAVGSGTTSSGIVSIATDVTSVAGYANGVQLHIDTDGIHGVYDGALKKGAFGNSQFQNRAVCFAFSYTT